MFTVVAATIHFAKKIDEATPMLEKGTLSPIDFINKIKHNDEQLCKSLSEFNVDALADDETELDREIEDALTEIENHVEKSNDVTPTIDDLDEAPPKEGACIACQTNMANMVFLHCNHNAVCSHCYDQVKKAHVTKINQKFKGDQRKIDRKIERVQYPVCNESSFSVVKIHANSFS